MGGWGGVAETVRGGGRVIEGAAAAVFCLSAAVCLSSGFGNKGRKSRLPSEFLPTMEGGSSHLLSRGVERSSPHGCIAPRLQRWLHAWQARQPARVIGSETPEIYSTTHSTGQIFSAEVVDARYNSTLSRSRHQTNSIHVDTCRELKTLWRW